MIDLNSQFMAILTAVGEAKQANADALGVPWTFTQMGVGDANETDPQPNRLQTKLINERRRAPLNQVRIDPKNSSVIIAEQVIPENVGGWWIREIGLYDADGDLVAVANCAPSFKPLLAQGTGKTQVVRINFIVTSAANVTLKIDPSVVLATRQYVDDRILEVLPPTRTPGSYTKVLIDKRGVVLEGSNPDTLGGMGIKDAYTKIQTDAFVKATVAAVIGGAPGALDTLQELANALGGDPNFANTIINALATKATKATTLGGYGILDAYTKVQTDDLLRLKAGLASPALTGQPTAPTAAAGNNSQQLANTAFVQATIAAVIGGAPGALDTLKELADSLGGDPNFANTLVNALAKKANTADVLLTGRSGTLSSLEIVGLERSPHIDFSDESGVDYKARIILTSDGALRVDGVVVDGFKIAGKTAWNAGNFDPASKADSADTYTKTQIETLLRNQASGRLIGVQTFNANGTYTPTAGTTSVVVEGVGGGGGSGGMPATPAGSGCISGSGAPGAYAKGRFTSGFSGVAVVIGAAGAAGSPSSNGGNGGTTSFGAVMTIPGGGGSALGQVGTVTNAGGGAPASAPTGGNILTAAGTTPPFAILAAASIATLTQSAVSLLGQKGAGGAGRYAAPSSPATVGGAGVSGTLIIWEYA